MNLRRLIRIVQKELRQLRRDRKTLRLLLLAPVLQMLVFGYAVTTDLNGVRLGVVLEDRSPEARQLIQAIVATRAFELRRASGSVADLQGWLDSGEVDVALHIPGGFAAAMKRGETPVVQVLSDGSDANTATLAFQYLAGAALSWARQARRDRLSRHPEEAIRFAGVPQVELEPRYWYNPDLKSVNFQVPGVLTLILLTVTITHTAMMVVRERELGTLEQLSVTPIRALELLVGKTIPVAGLGMLITTSATLVGTLWFHVPLRGSIPFLFLTAFLFLMNSMGLGLVVSVLSRTQLQAQLVVNVLTMPLMLLSGFLFPIANMPGWAQCLTYAMPTRYCVEAMRGVFLKGQGLPDLWPQALALATTGSLLYLGGILSFRKRTD